MIILAQKIPGGNPPKTENRLPHCGAGFLIKKICYINFSIYSSARMRLITLSCAAFSSNTRSGIAAVINAYSAGSS